MRQSRLWFMAVFACVVLVAAVLIAGQPTDAGQVAKAVFQVQGMTCSGCEAGVKVAIKKLPGIQSVKVSYAESRAEVSYRPSQIGAEKIRQAIEGLGYKAKLLQPAGTAVSATAVSSVERAPASGTPTLRDLANLEDLAALFRQTQGQPRIVLLLSPT